MLTIISKNVLNRLRPVVKGRLTVEPSDGSINITIENYGIVFRFRYHVEQTDICNGVTSADIANTALLQYTRHIKGKFFKSC